MAGQILQRQGCIMRLGEGSDLLGNLALIERVAFRVRDLAQRSRGTQVAKALARLWYATLRQKGLDKAGLLAQVSGAHPPKRGDDR